VPVAPPAEAPPRARRKKALAPAPQPAPAASRRPSARAPAPAFPGLDALSDAQRLVVAAEIFRRPAPLRPRAPRRPPLAPRPNRD
jgi:hypothetical protein